MRNIIYQLRQQTGLSQPELAKDIGMSVHSYRAIEENFPNLNTRIQTFIKIADYYGVSLDYLCERTTEPSSIPDITTKWHENFLARIDLSGQNKRTDPIDITKLRFHYPYNLLRDIFKSQSICHTSIVSEMFYKQLENKIEQLPERTRFFLREHYLMNKTFQTISHEHNLTKARVQQIIDDALTTLNNDLSPLVFDPKEKIEELLAQVDIHQKTLQEVQEKIFYSDLSNDYKEYQLYSQPIKQLPFSVRTQNALARANCTTVIDMLAIFATPEFTRIRNMGTLCHTEICDWINNQESLNVNTDSKHRTYVNQTQKAIAKHIKSIENFAILEIESQKYIGSLNYIAHKSKEFGALHQKSHDVSSVQLSVRETLERHTFTFRGDATITEYRFKRN